MLDKINQRNSVIPKVFDGELIEYNFNHAGLELAQATFIEENCYREIALLAKKCFHNYHRYIKILDLCSATGLASLRITSSIDVGQISLVDIDAKALFKGSTYFQSICSISLHCEDAVSFSSNSLYDLIVINSGYHHIDNDRKTAFLSNAASLLAVGGSIIVGDHFLPPYEDESEFRVSVVNFYTQLIQELKKQGEPNNAISVFRKSGLDCWQGHNEYKVSLNQFLKDVKKAELEVIDLIEVWKFSQCVPVHSSSQAGSFVFLLQKIERSAHE
jgi:SAM-dependent methyltransferase